LSGAAALSFAKGGMRHRQAGTFFFGSMLAMAGSGAVIAASIPERGTAVIGVITCYLVATSWVTARRRDGTAGRFELYAFFVAAGCAAVQLAFGLIAANSPDGRLDSLPAGAHFPFAALAALAAGYDLAFILRRRLSAAQRIARHLWRMCAALLIAAMSFFFGQQDEFPEAWRGSFVWLLPPLATFAAMLFWLLRIRFAKAWRGKAGPAAAVAA
ncbi:MAG: hypothetical protein M3N07_10440, partial [Pseudomonadota bacterium]|nr:hypothetical protein [Pseudomonadota bacterium]